MLRLRMRCLGELVVGIVVHDDAGDVGPSWGGDGGQRTQKLVQALRSPESRNANGNLHGQSALLYSG